MPLILVGMTRHVQITQNNKSAKSLQYLKKEVRDEVGFLCRRASQFSIYFDIFRYVVSLQYLQKELSYEVHVLHADEHEGLLQVNSIVFDGFGQACLN